MKQSISALMDGELFDDEAEALLNRLKGNHGTHAEWHTYHLIGDALRQPGHLHADISPLLRERLREEPVVLAPRAVAKQNARWFALSAAASVLALALVAWMSVQVGAGPGQQQMAMQQTPVQQQAGALYPAAYTGSRGMNDYLMAHQEFSPSNDVHGSASYIRTVAGL